MVNLSSEYKLNFSFMKSKLFNALKQAYSKLGLGDEQLQAYADSLAATGLVTDENLTTVVSGQENALKSFQSTIDRERQQKTAIQKSLDDYKAAHPEAGAQPEPGKISEDTIAKAVAAAIKPFSEKLETFEQKANGEKRSSEIASKAKEYGVPDVFVSRLNIAQDANLDDYFKGVKQDFANIGFEGVKAPEVGGGVNTNGSDIANLINQGTKQIVEQKK